MIKLSRRAHCTVHTVNFFFRKKILLLQKISFIQLIWIGGFFYNFVTHLNWLHLTDQLSGVRRFCAEEAVINFE